MPQPDQPLSDRTDALRPRLTSAVLRRVLPGGARLLTTAVLPALLLAGPGARADDAVPPAPADGATPATDASATTATTAAPAATATETNAPAATATATTATSATRASTGRAPTAGPQIEGPRDGVPDCRANAAVCWRSDHFAIWPRLRLRNGFEFVQPDAELLTVGQNDGFLLDQNRIGFDGVFRDDVRFRLILDVVSALPGAAPNDPVQNIGATVRDAWVAWLPSDWFYVAAGQQFMPSDLEGSTTISTLPFARRSVATSGVRPGHGLAVAGLSPSRQMGLVVGSTDARIGSFAVEYAAAVSNGNGQNVLGNDNKLPAAYARVGAGWVDDDVEVRLGLGGRYNPRTVGTLPNLFTETDAVGFADLSARAFGVVVAAQAIARSTTFDTVLPDGSPGDTGLGATAWLQLDRPFGLDLYGVKPAYRFSWYDPSSVFPDDQLLENTVGIRWDPPVPDLPLALFVDGTLLTEFGEGVRDLDNARLTALVQFDF
jgi:hypothetical protein